MTKMVMGCNRRTPGPGSELTSYRFWKDYLPSAVVNYCLMTLVDIGKASSAGKAKNNGNFFFWRPNPEFG